MGIRHLTAGLQKDALPRRQRRRLRCIGGYALATNDAILTRAVSVGLRVRQLREEQNLSMRVLAEKSGLAINTLSLIENEKTSPSVSTLQQIARALQVPITAFFESDLSSASVVCVKASQRARASFAYGTLEDLGVGFAHHAVEPFVVTLAPNTGSGAQPIVHTGYEFVYCLAGRVTYTIQDRSYLLEPGDSLLFESHLPHHWQNPESELAQVLLVIYPTDTRDRSTEQHFVPKVS